MPLRSQEVVATILETVRAHCQSPLAENVPRIRGVLSVIAI
jgi:hypothetical protein